MSESFLKEVIANVNNNSLLVLINQKDHENGVNFLVEKLLLERDEQIILITLTKSSTELTKKFKNENLILIDGFSQKSQDQNNIIFIGPECNFTKLQIGIEKAIEKLSKKGIIIIDSLNRLSIYNNPNELAKFIYLFSNKTKLEGLSAVFFIEKNSFDPDSLEKIKSFSDKTFDYSALSALKILPIN